MMHDRSTITATRDHPFWIAGKGWCAYQPEGAQARRVGRYVIGDRFLVYDGVKGVREVLLRVIKKIKAPAETYTLELDSGGGFIGNGLITGTEHGKE
jgi:hypothetical protein